MTLEQLLRAARSLVDDVVPPFLYPTADIVRWLNNAIREAAIRTRLLQDDTSAVCRIALVPGQARYQLDPCILVVRAAYVPEVRKGLELVTAAQLDRLAPGWAHIDQSANVGARPRWAIFDVGQKAMTVHPAPTYAGVLHLRVWRMPRPAEEFETPTGDDAGFQYDLDAEPVLRLATPEELKHWVAREAYLSKDSELYDPQRAAQHEELFTRTFGPRPTEHELSLWSRSRLNGQRMHSEY